LVARAQAALADEHLGGALRQVLDLYDLLVPPLDAWVKRQSGAAAQMGEDAAPMSAAIGLIGLWSELPDIDVERESIEELLVFYAAHADPASAPVNFSTPISTRQELAAALALLPPPRSRFFSRFARRATGSLGDRGHITVQRGAQVVLERPPPVEPAAQPKGGIEASFCSELGPLCEGDRLTLRWVMPLPGNLAVVHAVGDGPEAELSLLLPQDASEAVTRRHHEVVEVVGELSVVPNCPEHGLVVIFGPELLPASWAKEMVARRSVPPQSRVFFYRYTVHPSSHAS
jgi:hypothetical protein